MLTAYAMFGFELVEKLFRRSYLFLFRILEALPDAFLGIGAGSNVEQMLVGFGILNNSRGLALHGEHHRALAFLQLFHEIAGTPAEGGQRLNVAGDVKHEPTP